MKLFLDLDGTLIQRKGGHGVEFILKNVKDILKIIGDKEIEEIKIISMAVGLECDLQPFIKKGIRDRFGVHPSAVELDLLNAEYQFREGNYLLHQGKKFIFLYNLFLNEGDGEFMFFDDSLEKDEYIETDGKKIWLFKVVTEYEKMIWDYKKLPQPIRVEEEDEEAYREYWRHKWENRDGD